MIPIKQVVCHDTFGVPCRDKRPRTCDGGWTTALFIAETPSSARVARFLLLRHYRPPFIIPRLTCIIYPCFLRPTLIHSKIRTRIGRDPILNQPEGTRHRTLLRATRLLSLSRESTSATMIYTHCVTLRFQCSRARSSACLGPPARARLHWLDFSLASC